MSKHRFSQDKEINVKAIREMISYMRATFQVHCVSGTQLVDVKAIERFADKVEDGRIQ